MLRIISYGRSFILQNSTSKLITNANMSSNSKDKGSYVRVESAFRNFITADGSSGFKAEANRYHLYVSLACPWANRTLIVRALKGLENVISYTVVDWFHDDKGWSFTDKVPKCSLDTVNNCTHVRQIYQKVEKDYAGRVTIPLLWDKQKATVVSNESAEIIEMFNSEFNEFCATEEQKKIDLYPANLKSKIDEVNEWIYKQVNNGVYQAGFATSQEAYDEAVKTVFSGLDKVESILQKNRYLCGDELTLADVRLFTSLMRFDKVYVGHFKCNKKRIVDYPSIWGYTRELYQNPKIKSTIDFDHIVNHYHRSHKMINPSGVVPIGPDIDFDEPHGRDHLTKSKTSA